MTSCDPPRRSSAFLRATSSPLAARADLGELGDVRPADGARQILLRPLDDLGRLAEAVVLAPVLGRHDLEEVAEPAELRDGVEEVRGGRDAAR
jgi:hypothetical protein